MTDWRAHLPESIGDLPGGGVLRRTDPSGPAPATIAVLGVYPALTEKRIFTIDGVRVSLPTEVEGLSFEGGSASGAEIDGHYLHPLSLTRRDVFITDMMPYYFANTKKSTSGRSMADNVRLYESSIGTTTGIEPRPSSAKLVKLASEMPGNLDRLRDYFDRCKPCLLLTLGTEAAAFVRGMTFSAAYRQVDELFYGQPMRTSFLGIDAQVVHLVHPHLFIKRNAKWMNRHEAWCQASGRDLVAGAPDEGPREL